MANKRWIGAALAVAQVDTVTVANTWATGDEVTLTINNKSLVLTVGTDVTTANVATAIKEMVNGDTQTGTGDHTFSETGDNVPEFAELTATVSSSVVTLTGKTKGKPFTLTVTETTAGDGTATEATATAATGPNHWDNIFNWDTGAVPVSGVNEVQTVTVDATSGNWKIAFNGSPLSAGIAFDAAASAAQSAIEALSTVGAGNVSVTGGPGAAGGGTPYTITFQNALGYQNVAQVTTDNDTLAGGASTATPATSQAGSSGDDVYLDYTATSILYALSQSAIALNSLNIAANFTGSIGLPKTNRDSTAYVEYRTDYLTLSATTVNIGLGDGTGSGRIKLNVGANFCTLNVFSTGTNAESNLPAVIWKGTNAYNALNVRGRSSVGAGVFGGETATILTLDQSGQSTVTFGDGVTLTTAEMNGSDLTLLNGCTTLTLFGGRCTVQDGAVTTANVLGGTLIYNSTGTLGTASVSENGVLDFSQNPRTKTVTNPIERYSGQSSVIDPEKTVTSLIIDNNQTADTANLRLGPNVRVTRGTVA